MDWSVSGGGGAVVGMSAEWTADDLLFRQVHPNHLNGMAPNSVAFMPTPKDDDLLSVDDARLTTAQSAWNHFTVTLGFKSAGTWAVSTSDVNAAGNLTYRSAPVANVAEPAKSNLAHCLIDFTKLASKGERKRCAQALALRATVRGCLFKPAA